MKAHSLEEVTSALAEVINDTVSKAGKDEQLTGVELNSHKEMVRALIAAQVMKAGEKNFLQNSGNGSFLGATLPGDRFLFEHQLRGMGLVGGIEFKFDCAESNGPRFMEALCHKPTWCRLAKTDFHDLIRGNEFSYDRNGLAVGMKQLEDIMTWDAENELTIVPKNQYGFVWADYCCTATEEIHEKLAKFVELNLVSHNKTLLVYMTFSTSRSAAAEEGSQYDAIDKSFLDDFQSAEVSARYQKSVRQILSVKYSGGCDYTSRMYTLGFAIGKDAAKIQPKVIDLRRSVGDTGRYNHNLWSRRDLIGKGKFDYTLSESRLSVANKQHVEKVVTAFVKHQATAEEKDEIIRIARALQAKYLGATGVLNEEVLHTVNKKYPDVTKRNVSSTISTNVTHPEAFNRKPHGKAA